MKFFSDNADNENKTKAARLYQETEAEQARNREKTQKELALKLSEQQAPKHLAGAKLEAKLPECRRCHHKGHTSTTCIRPKSPTSKE